MKPVRLTMQAFGSYGRKTEIDFTKPEQNLFLITGDTGAGKSTIFDALVFALYGEASSMGNKKDGTELQSQYAELDADPFSELVFSEESGGEALLYIVYRTPRHIRPLKKGTGTKEEKESVQLSLPDGSIYPGNKKATDEKIVEIVGLTKEQFCQVAMIAQGEFMELLRAKSDAKKQIFRKLFNTGIYQNLIDELAGRRKEKLAEIAQIKTICRNEAGRVTVPEKELLRKVLNSSKESAPETDAVGSDPERLAALVCALRDRIIKEERLSIAELEEFLSGLEALCKELAVMQSAAEAAYAEKTVKRDLVFAEYSKAELLDAAFGQMEQARKDLAECKAQESEIKAQAELAAKLLAAFELRMLFERFEDITTQTETVETKCRELDERLPGLVLSLEKASTLHDQARRAMEKALEEFTRISENTETLKQRFEEDAFALTEAGKQVLFQREQSEKLLAEYQSIRKNYEEKNREYEAAHTAFLDAQAGYIAKELLKEGHPCPVCGSLEHPSPCTLPDENRVLSRERLEEMAGEVAGLQTKRETMAASAESAALLLEDRQAQFKALAEKFLSLHAGKGRDIQITAENAGRITACLKEEMEAGTAAVLEEAAGRKNSADQNYRAKNRAFQEAKASKETAEGLLERYRKELPELLEQGELRRTQYEESLRLHEMEETAWRTLLEQYDRSDLERIQNAVSVFQKKEALARGALEAAEQTIGGQEKPVLEALKKQKEEIEQSAAGTFSVLDELRTVYRTDREVLSSLSSRIEARKDVVAAFDRIDSLYRRLSGNAPGGRMDIETYVQRFYLQRILAAANLRFREMSAGQFELRMVEEEFAGAGRNRGLDLMVFSAVTGKEREIRTLSGGESFMAALALALGMADQIREVSSSVNLDIMFIDEGFGSLDEHSRDQAVKVLRRMAEGTRLTGLISHVTELKQEIEDQLIVTKDENGSRVRWQLS